MWFVKFEKISRRSISSRLALLNLQNSSSCSNPANLRPHRLAAMPVVELPLNGSRTQSPGLVDARIILTSKRNGFCVGCLPQVLLKLALP